MRFGVKIIDDSVLLGVSFYKEITDWSDFIIWQIIKKSLEE